MRTSTEEALTLEDAVAAVAAWDAVPEQRQLAALETLGADVRRFDVELLFVARCAGNETGENFFLAFVVGGVEGGGRRGR